MWGAPHNANEWLRILTAQDFQHNVSLSLGVWGANMAHLAWDLTRTGTLPFTLLGVYGLWKRDPDRELADSWAVLAALLVGTLMISANVPYRARNPDYGGYLLVPLALACAGIARICVRDSVRTSVLLVGLSASAIAGFVSRRREPGLRERRAHWRPLSYKTLLATRSWFSRAITCCFRRSTSSKSRISGPGHHDTEPWVGEFELGLALRARSRPLVARRSHARNRPHRTTRGGTARTTPRQSHLERVGRFVGQRRSASGICPRGLLWSSSEGCAGPGAAVDAVVGLLAHEWRRGSDDGWDRATVEVSGETLGNGALELGCPGLALRYFAASIASTTPMPGPTRGCDGRHIAPIPQTGLLEIDEATLRHDIQRVLSSP